MSKWFYQAAISKDARFDGVFFIGGELDGHLLPPVVPGDHAEARAHAVLPQRRRRPGGQASAPASGAAGRLPRLAEWNIRADVVGRAMRLIADGAVDREGVRGWPDGSAYQQLQVRPLITAELGAGPLAIARAQRAQTARVLTETTALPLSEIAFAAGFTSIRQFNATIQEVFAVTPTELRDRAARR